MICKLLKVIVVLLPLVFLSAAFVVTGNVTPPGECKWGSETYTDIPGYIKSQQSNHTCDHFDPNETALAMFLFYVHYVEEFGDEDDKVNFWLHDLTVIWTDQIIKMRGYGFKVNGEPAKTNAAFGLTLRHGRVIKVYTRRVISMMDEKRISKTSFVHELLHVAINAKNGGVHGDPDHEGSQWPGWTPRHTEFINKVNSVYRLIDL